MNKYLLGIIYVPILVLDPKDAQLIKSTMTVHSRPNPSQTPRL